VALAQRKWKQQVGEQGPGRSARIKMDVVIHGVVLQQHIEL